MAAWHLYGSVAFILWSPHPPFISPQWESSSRLSRKSNRHYYPATYVFTCDIGGGSHLQAILTNLGHLYIILYYLILYQWVPKMTIILLNAIISGTTNRPTKVAIVTGLLPAVYDENAYENRSSAVGFPSDINTWWHWQRDSCTCLNNDTESQGASTHNALSTMCQTQTQLQDRCCTTVLRFT